MPFSSTFFNFSHGATLEPLFGLEPLQMFWSHGARLGATFRPKWLQPEPSGNTVQETNWVDNPKVLLTVRLRILRARRWLAGERRCHCRANKRKTLHKTMVFNVSDGIAWKLLKNEQSSTNKRWSQQYWLSIDVEIIYSLLVKFYRALT